MSSSPLRPLACLTVTWLLAASACSHDSASALTPDGGDDAPGVSRRDGSHDGYDAHDPPPDATKGCGLCNPSHDAGGGDSKGSGGDASMGGMADTGHDAGHDTGKPGMAPLGQHTANVPIDVTTATGTVTRTYSITLPATCSASTPLPLVFAFHGDGGNGEAMRSAFPIEQAATTAGGQAIFVYPNGTNENIDPGGVARAWDLYHDPGPSPYAYTPGTPVPAESDEASGNVDVDFFDTMVESFETMYCVDPSRIFITGMSSGGYLSNQFARWRSGIVSGTAPQSGGAPFGNNDGSGDWTPPNYCIGPTGKVPALIIHGTADSTVDVCNAIETQSYWELTNGCTGSAGNCTTTADSCTGSNLADPSSAPTSASSLNSDCVASEGCGANLVVLCEVPGMGHTIWTDAATVIWSFFSSL
jgi:polyhydroxybutyrate depolymerase